MWLCGACLFACRSCPWQTLRPKVFLSAIALAANVIYWICVLTLATLQTCPKNCDHFTGDQFPDERFSRVSSATTSFRAAVSDRSSLTSGDVACRAVSPATQLGCNITMRTRSGVYWEYCFNMLDVEKSKARFPTYYRKKLRDLLSKVQH